MLNGSFHKFVHAFVHAASPEAERFKSVLVEDQPSAVEAVTAYVDLNPVRAGLVKDPKEYRWCGYAEAVAGSELARKGLGISEFSSDWGLG